MTENADDVVDVAGRNIAAAAMVASRAVEPITAALQQRAAQRARQLEVETRRTQREIEAQRRLMHAELRPVLSPTWWAQDATVEAAAAAWHLANAWRGHDELASTAAAAIEQRAPEQFGSQHFDLALARAAANPRELTVTEDRDGTPGVRTITEAEALKIIEATPTIDAQGPAEERTDLHDIRRWKGIALDVDAAIATKFPDLMTDAEHAAVREATGQRTHAADLEQARRWLAETDPEGSARWERQRDFNDTVEADRQMDNSLIDRWRRATTPDTHDPHASAARREQRDQAALAEELLSEATRHDDVDPERADDLREQAQIHQDLADAAGDAAVQHQHAPHGDRVEAVAACVEGLDPQGARGRIVAAKGNVYAPAAAARAPKGSARARRGVGRAQKVVRERTQGL